MRVMLNATNLHSGGGVQVASGLCDTIMVDSLSSVRWSLVISNAVSQNMTPVANSNTDCPIEVVDMRPRHVLAARRARSALSDEEKRFRPDIVLTVLGPPYWKPKAPHLCGFAVPWVIFGGGKAWRTIPPLLRPFVYVTNVHRKRNLSRRWFYWTETSSAASALAGRLAIGAERVQVIANSANRVYLEARASWPEAAAQPWRKWSEADPFKILCLSSYYPHKNLEMIPEVAKRMLRMGLRDFLFELTLPQSGRGWARIDALRRRLGVVGQVTNLGAQPVSECPRLYLDASAVFLPTLLEVASAVYYESAAMRRPLVTTDIPPAREICGDTALLFPPFDTSRAAEMLASLITNRSTYDQIVEACARRADRATSEPTKLELMEIALARVLEKRTV
ncbi:MAG: glycosyltransferase [Thermoleophilia bacterium]